MKCWLFHRWTKWTDTIGEVARYRFGQPEKVREQVVQTRTCERCGLRQIRPVIS